MAYRLHARVQRSCALAVYRRRMALIRGRTKRHTPARPSPGLLRVHRRRLPRRGSAHRRERNWVACTPQTHAKAGDRGGFVVNALLVPYLVNAIRMLDSGYATMEDIDSGMNNGCAYPMGPFTLCDTVGLDIVLDTAESLYQEFREPHLAPPPLLKRMVSAGRLGKKTGRGFYDHS